MSQEEFNNVMKMETTWNSEMKNYYKFNELLLNLTTNATTCSTNTSSNTNISRNKYLLKQHFK